MTPRFDSHQCGRSSGAGGRSHDPARDERTRSSGALSSRDVRRVQVFHLGGIEQALRLGEDKGAAYLMTAIVGMGAA